MKNEKANSCAVCGAPIKPGLDLCGVCKKETTRKTAMVACRACGATNAGSAKVCSECGAPLSAETKSPSGDEVGDAVGASETVRRAELQVLEDCFDVCAEKGRGGGAIVTGESGMGVTTLLKSFAGALESRISTRRVHYVLVRDEGEPFAPLRSIVRQALDISDDDDATSARLRLTDRVGKVLGPSSAALVTECAHILGYLGGVQFPKSPVLRALEGDAELMNRRIKETFVRYFEADIRAEPTVFIFDDLQKTEDATQIGRASCRERV
jgi:ribosomal protein L37E/energy-coupling factor transporter ATP-binding protein EcfA2